jgi:hypothetical protein
MNAVQISKYIILFVIIVILPSCEKYDDYSPIPHVTYDTLQPKTSNGSKFLEISIDFIDGDGDLCIPNDTVKNLIFTLYQLENDTFKKVDLTVPYEFSIPYYEPEGRNKLMQGKILNKFYMSDLQQFDTIKFSFYVFDRAGNNSNTEYTPEIILSNY